MNDMTQDESIKDMIRKPTPAQTAQMVANLMVTLHGEVKLSQIAAALAPILQVSPEEAEAVASRMWEQDNQVA